MAALFRRSSAPVEISPAEAKLPPMALAPPSAGVGVDVYRLQFGVHVLACGLLWAPETKSAGRAVVAAREVAREARARRKAHEKQRSRRARSGLQGTDEDLTGTAEEMAASAANDLVVIRPIASDLLRSDADVDLSALTGAIPVRDRTEAVEQYAFGSTMRGHEPDDLSLAALVAERAGLPNAVFLLRIDATESPLYYYLVVHGGLIRTGSDRCFTDVKEAQLHLHQFVMTLRDTRAEKAFRFIFSPDIDFGLVECERRSIEEFLEGPAPFVLRPLFFRLSRREQRRLLLGAAATVALGAIGWYGLKWMADQEMRDSLARRAEETARRARAARKRLVIDPVRQAPWEITQVRRVSRFVRAAVSAALDVPTFVLGDSGAPGAYDLELVRVSDGRVSARYLVLTAPPDVEGGQSPQWPVRVERDWDWFPDRDLVVAFAPVPLQSVLDGLQKGTAVGTALRNALIRHLRAVDRVTYEVFEVVVHPGHTEIGKAESAGEVAWVAQHFELRLRSRPDASTSLLEVLDAVPALQVTEVGYLDDDKEKWLVRGYVAGALDVLAETRRLQKEMGAEGIGEG